MADSRTNNNNSVTSERFATLWLVLLVIAGTYLRVHGTWDYHFNIDEAMITDISSGNTAGKVWQYSLFETHPPLLYILLHYWLMISDNPAFVRAFSLLFGVPLIVLYYAIGKKLNGPFTGLVCATLITFSEGCITQSYIVRHYSLFLFLLSAGFYCYLCWREDHKPSALLGYAAFACLACLTDFSAMLAIFCIGTCEGAQLLWHKAPLRRQATWALVHMCLAAAALSIYSQWMPLVVRLQSDYTHSADYQHIAQHRFLSMLYYIFAFDYVLLYLSCAITGFLMLILPIANAIYNPKSRPFLILAAIATGVGITVATIYIGYNQLGGRHALWLLPFLVIAAGFALGDTGERVSQHLNKYRQLPWQSGMAALLFATGWLLFNPISHFSIMNEYSVPLSPWQAFDRYLKTLDGNHLLVADRLNVFLIDPAGFNPYDYIANDVSLIPRKPSPILFAIMPNDIFIPSMQKAFKGKALQDAQTLVFINSIFTSWIKRTPVMDMITCPALDKTIVTFPPLAEGVPVTQETLRHTPISLLIVSRAAFLNDVLAANGKAHHCLTDSKTE